MKVFWSWQADTPSSTGRVFVRNALKAAIEKLKVPPEIEEPQEREARAAVHLDHDRQGLPGSPDLASAIFRKIDAAGVFVADVTLVGDGPAPENSAHSRKKLINSNVAIELGYALRSVGDAKILMVQNTFYGDREQLPFDLRHKAGPIQFSLSPTAAKDEINRSAGELRGAFVVALRPYLNASAAPTTTEFAEIPATDNDGVFFRPDDILAVVGEDEDRIEYSFNEPRLFYLRLIPTRTRERPLRLVELQSLVDRRKLAMLSRTVVGGFPGRNPYGAAQYDPHGTSPTPLALTQVFPNGELWGITRDLFTTYDNKAVIPAGNVVNFFARVLSNFVQVSANDLGSAPPYTVEMGAVGISEHFLGANWREVYGPILQPAVKVRRILNEVAEPAQKTLIREFIGELGDKAGADASGWVS
jgi:hypothetical protein